MSKQQKIYAITIILIAVCALSAYLMVFQSYGHYGVWLGTLCIFLLFIAILILQFLWIDVAPGSVWTYNVRALAVIIVMVPIVYGLIKAEHNYEDGYLQKNGIEATELITYTYKTSGNNVGVSYHAVYQYVVNGQTYTHSLRDSHNIYKVGDTVRIVYSSEHPEIDKVINYTSQR